MTDPEESNEKRGPESESEIETKIECYVDNENVNNISEEKLSENENPLKVEDVIKEESVNEESVDNTAEQEKTSCTPMEVLPSPESPKISSDVCDEIKTEECYELPQVVNKSETFPEKSLLLSSLLKSDIKSDEGGHEEKETPVNPDVNKVISLQDGFTDSSQSSSSELQSSAAPFESSCSSQENNFNANRINFENAIEPEGMWMETNDSTAAPETVETSIKPETETTTEEEEVNTTTKVSPTPEIPLITIDDSTQQSAPLSDVVIVNESEQSSLVGSELPNIEQEQQEHQSEPMATDTQPEIKIEEPVVQEVPTEPVPIVPPTPRKRGRPRKQVLPNPSPIVESWGPNAQEFPTLGVNAEAKRSARAERRQTKRKKFEDEKDKQVGDEGTPKRRFNLKPPVKKKKRRTTYTPKKKLPPPKKKHSEMENIQNFEEETRMSASEGPAGFSSRSGAMGDESQGSSMTTEGHTRSNINKKGRMEVMTDGCKPVTVQQIVEYFWPPPSSLPHGEKPEGLMIQEQITEYLGVKSFKRRYPSIKRRPVDMEERNYLQENGFVSENMCDMGLTAVFSADIIEIMYNDFPQKFEEYRKYTREKKAKEQRALREKQAAERADIDPKKEAIEATLSWNSEFNKTRKFTVVHEVPCMRLINDGVPCPALEKVVILHTAENQPLCVENDHWKMSLFANECEISARKEETLSKNCSSKNLWMFVLGPV